MAFREIRPGERVEGPALILPAGAVAVREQGSHGTAEERPLFYYLQSGGQTVVVCNAMGQRMRIPEDELQQMAQETAARLEAKRAAEREAWAQAETDWWLDWHQWIRDHQRGRQSFGPATFAGDRGRGRTKE